MTGTGTDSGADGRVLAGRYRVVEQLGRGGMGMVCRAVDEVLGREVAVKELRTFADASAEELADLRLRMQREARAAARIRHAGVISVHDVAEDDGRPVIVMELVDGPSLADVLAERGAMDPREAAGIGARVADALGAAHAAGVLHRDVKPGNVLLERGGRVVLTDFGIATMEDPGDGAADRLTQSGQLVGSLDFLAPERAQGRRPGPASDIWSLGAMLYAAVEGGSPFRRTSTWSTLSAIITEPVPEPRAAGPLAPVLAMLLAKDPEARPDAARARELLEAVARGVSETAEAAEAAGAAVPDRDTRELTADRPAAERPQAAAGQEPPAASGAPFTPPPAAAAQPQSRPAPPFAGGLSARPPEQGWRPPAGEVRPTRPVPAAGADRAKGGRRRTAVAVAAAVAVVLAGAGVTWAMMGRSGDGGGGDAGGRTQAQAPGQPTPGIPVQGLVGGPSATGAPSGSASARVSASAPVAARGGSTATAAAPGAPVADAPAGTSPAPATPKPPTGDPGYLPDSLASTEGCLAWLDYKVSGTGGFAMGTLESAGQSCEMHFFRTYVPDAKSSQNLNTTHVQSGPGSQSTYWYWDGPNYYAGVCVWRVGDYAHYSCGGRYYVANGKPRPH